MCDDHFSRRSFLHGAGALAAGAVLLPQQPGRHLPSRLPLRSLVRPADGSGNFAYSMAMHVHTSFSEYDGSMDSQLYQATTNAVDVMWWTDHDHRMNGLGYRDAVHFTSLTAERGAPGQGGAWHWQQRQSGSLRYAPGSGIVTTPCSPNDPVAGGSLFVKVKAKSGGTARRGFYADCTPAGWNYRDNLNGQSLSVDVLLSPGWASGYLEILINTSYHEASAGRPAGDYSLSYRLVPSGTGSSAAQGNQGIMTIPVTPAAAGKWTTITINPARDIAALWPDLDYRDFALYMLTLSAVSAGELVSGYFDYLRFNRSTSGEAALTQQAAMMTALARSYPNVAQRQGLEVSWHVPHVNWFGGNVTVPQYSQMSQRQWATHVRSTIIPQIHAAGGLASYNHPYGVTFSTALLPAAQQDAKLAAVAQALLPSAGNPAACGADILEVGYPVRAGCDLAHHVALWDVMSRNAVFLTGNGTNDDHWGHDWYNKPLNWTTSVWAASSGQSDLLAALAAGRAWCGSLNGFGAPGASLDLTVDGTCPMGSASLSALPSRLLTVTAAGIPAGGSLQVLQGTVDYAGTNGLTSNAQVIARYSAKHLASNGGRQALPVDNTVENFVRTQVLDASGNVVGLSNPAWLLQKAPPGGIPAPRAA